MCQILKKGFGVTILTGEIMESEFRLQEKIITGDLYVEAEM
jgi:hypothetical protein